MEDHDHKICDISTLRSSLNNLNDDLIGLKAFTHKTQTPQLTEIRANIIQLRSDLAKLTAQVVRLEAIAQIQDRQITALENPHKCDGC